LPGVPAAPLLDRQFWWVATVVATATGLAVVAFRHSPLSAAIGILLIMAPHLVGAPRLDHSETNVSDSLSRQFIVAVTLTALPCWALLGALTGNFYRKFSATGEGGQIAAAQIHKSCRPKTTCRNGNEKHSNPESLDEER
jgi:predicted cobalt transporter CbtA